MSGTVSRSAISNSVFVEQSVGMKHTRGDPTQIKDAHDENERRLNNLQKDLSELAKSLDLKLQNFLKNNEGAFVLDKIQSDYGFFIKNQAGYSRFATLTTNEEVEKAKGEGHYILLSAENTIVIRFKVTPKYEMFEKMKLELLSEVR